VPGSYRAKNPEISEKRPKSSKRPKSPVLRIPASAARGVLHQPLAAGPCTRFRDLPGEGWISGLPGGPGPGPPEGPLGPPGTPGPRDGDRAPPRGVDV